MLRKISIVLSVLILFSFNLSPSMNAKVVSVDPNVTRDTLIPNDEFNMDDELKLNEPVIIHNTKAELVEVSDNYQKIKLTDLEDDSVEFIEEFSENGEEYIEAHSEKESFRIEVESKDNLIMRSNLLVEKNTPPVIMITNLKTNKKEQLEIKEETINTDIMPFSTADGFGYINTTTGNASLNRALKSWVIGVVAQIAGVPTGRSIIISIGTFLFDNSAPHVYYMKGNWVKSINIYTARYRTYTSYFRYHDYTGGKIKSDVIREWDYTQT